jgi:hypothetical protein
MAAMNWDRHMLTADENDSDISLEILIVIFLLLLAGVGG